MNYNLKCFPFPLDFITSQLVNRTYTMWVGLSIRRSKYRWTDNNEVTYTNWARGEPNGANNGVRHCRRNNNCIPQNQFRPPNFRVLQRNSGEHRSLVMADGALILHMIT